MLGLAAERQLQTRAAAAGVHGFRVVRATLAQPGANDPAQLAYAADHGLVLVTRNAQDFLRLNEMWTVLREWGYARRTHSGILMPFGQVLDRDWADQIVDLLFHPNCPLLADQLLLWHASAGRWEVDRPYASQRRQILTL
jgi:hypothetical protein